MDSTIGRMVEREGLNMFKFTPEEIERVEKIVNRFIKVKTEHPSVINDSLHVRDIIIGVELVEVSLLVATCTPNIE
jgi:hypothetical protein